MNEAANIQRCSLLSGLNNCFVDHPLNEVKRKFQFQENWFIFSAVRTKFSFIEKISINFIFITKIYRSRINNETDCSASIV